MTVVVTGATGHVGANLVRELLQRGRKVRVLIHQEEIGLEGLDVERVTGDVRDLATLERAFADAEIVYHLAAVISIVGDPDGRVHAVNVDGARNAAQAALRCGVRRFVHTCSIHAFDQAPLSEPLDEQRARVVSRSHPAYDRSKAAGEAEVRKVISEGLDAVIIHPTAVIGPHDYRPSRLGRLFIDLYHRRLPALVSGGFDWVDVRDLVAGILSAEERGRRGESYLLSGTWHSVRELAQIAAEVTGVPAPRLTTPMWLARVGAPFAEGWSKLTRKEPMFTREALAALRANREIVRVKARDELAYTARPTAESVREIYAWLEGAGMLAKAA